VEVRGQSTRIKSIEKKKYFEIRDFPFSLLSEIFDSPCDVCFVGTNTIEARSSRWRNLSMKPDGGKLVYRIVRIQMPS